MGGPPADDAERVARRRWILRCARHGGVGAEIGVFRGHFAAEIATVLQPSKLYLVDPWTRGGDRYQWGDGCAETNFNTLTTRAALAETRARMARFSPQTEVVFVEAWSHEFCASLTELLDFVYLDAD